VRLDVTIEAGWEVAMARVRESWGRLDVLVVSAGSSLARPVDRSKEGVYEPVYAHWRQALEGCGVPLPHDDFQVLPRRPRHCARAGAALERFLLWRGMRVRGHLGVMPRYDPVGEFVG
jgi:hypothetical protein